MNTSSLKYPFANLKFDFTSGIVVFLVAIPLCLGIALASGAPLMSGLIAGVVGGIVVGSISQSSVSVSGPAAGLVAVVLVAIAQLGSFDTFLLAVFFAGIFQILIGSFRAGFIADYIPSNVIQGLICAIGILIAIKQLPLAFGYINQSETLMGTLKTAQEGLKLGPITHLLSHINLGATIITLFSFFILIYWEKTSIKKLKKIPAPVVVVLMGIVINEIYSNAFPNLTLFSNFLVSIPVPESIHGFFSQLATPNWSMWLNPSVYTYAAIIAIVASLESLLNLEAAEKLDKKKRYCSRNRELIAQGIGNTLSGLLGGIPITSVVVRSSVNIQAGSKSKLSTIFHGTLILLAIAFIPEWLNLIPLASLAALLIFIGYKLSKVSIYKAMYKEGYSRFIPFISTVIAIVATDLLTGVLIGLFISFFFILRENSKTRLDLIDEERPHGSFLRMLLSPQMTFLNKAGLITELGLIPENSNLILDATQTNYIDHDILEVLNEFKNVNAKNRNINVNLIGLKDHYNIHDHIDYIHVTTKEAQTQLTAANALQILKEGNKRFINEQRIHRHYRQQIKATAKAQHPFAVILTCIDSRVPVESIFDVRVGDVFCCRVAGNVLSNDILASIEYACAFAGAKLIVVMGHTNCGAIAAACDEKESGHITELLKKIEPAIQQETQTKEDRNSQNSEFMLNVTQNNVNNIKKRIYNESDTLKSLLDDDKISMVGAMYHVEDGQVHF